jgi:hypothetical protein
MVRRSASQRSRVRGRAFSLIELMIAMVFLTIAFFGYVALHARILHSGQRLEEREVIRSATDFYSGMLVSRAMLGMTAGPEGRSFIPVATVPNLYKLDTSPPPSIAWLSENLIIPQQFSQGMDETMQLAPEILAKPYTYSWKKR